MFGFKNFDKVAFRLSANLKKGIGLDRGSAKIKLKSLDEVSSIFINYEFCLHTQTTVNTSCFDE